LLTFHIAAVRKPKLAEERPYPTNQQGDYLFLLEHFVIESKKAKYLKISVGDRELEGAKS
jgi:hypothetical protein